MGTAPVDKQAKIVQGWQNLHLPRTEPQDVRP
jgi:hypothetical protein